jgi:Ca2+-binding RTX toxin-like protein
MQGNTGRRALLLLVAMGGALVVGGGTAFAALIMGTAGNDTLTGTTANDQITGLGGADTSSGHAGNDVYYFDDGWGQDTVNEPATQKVRVKRNGEWVLKTVSGGSDTLTFSQMSAFVDVRMMPQWGSAYHRAISGGDRVNLGTSRVENVTGGTSGDLIETGAGRNTLQPGGGALDQLYDYGGWTDAGGNPDLPVSSDVFKGFESNNGTDRVHDFGGAADVVDLRPFSSSNVYVAPVDADGNGTLESLQIGTSPSAQVVIAGHFSAYLDYTSTYGQQGRVESLVFSDGTFSGLGGTEASDATVGELMDASEVRSSKTSGGAELEGAAKKLLEQAQGELAKGDGPEPTADTQE